MELFQDHTSPFISFTGVDMSNWGSRLLYSNEPAIELMLSSVWYCLKPGPVFCLLLGVSSDYAQPITGQVTEVTCPVIGWTQSELTSSKRQKMDPDIPVVSLLAFHIIQMQHYPDSEVHGANMGPIWGRQDPGGPHVGPINFVIWVIINLCIKIHIQSLSNILSMHQMEICIYHFLYSIVVWIKV